MVAAEGVLERRPAMSSSRTVASLTARETEVLRAFARGLLYKEIAHEMGVSFSTIRKHASNIYRKLGVRNRAGAIVVWLTEGIGARPSSFSAK